MLFNGRTFDFAERACCYTPWGVNQTGRHGFVTACVCNCMIITFFFSYYILVIAFPQNFGLRKDTVFCGVFDGHGPFGHLVAKKVRDSLPVKLSAHWEVNISSDSGLKEDSTIAAGSMNSEETSFICMEEESRITMNLEEKEKHPQIFLTLKESFLKAFKVTDKELRVHPNIDCFCSGTTAVTLVKQVIMLVQILL